MRKTLAVLLFGAVCVTGVAFAQQRPGPTKPSGKPQDAPLLADVERYKAALSDSRRKLFEEGMSGLTGPTSETFWAIYKDYESDKNDLADARTNLLKKFSETFRSTEGVSDDDITEAVQGLIDFQHENIDLRLKYFGVISERIDVKTAGRFALIDDYHTTSVRLEWLSQFPFPGDAEK